MKQLHFKVQHVKGYGTTTAKIEIGCVICEQLKYFYVGLDNIHNKYVMEMANRMWPENIAITQTHWHFERKHKK